MDNSFEQLELIPANRSLPPYQIRESKRARHVSIKISLQGDVEVVVPPRFDPNQVPDILARRQEWIIQTVHRLKRKHTELAPSYFEEQPTQLELRFCGETWRIFYQTTERAELRLTQTAPKSITLSGFVSDSKLCTDLLRQWLTRKARAELSPWLRELSFEIELPFNRVSIRGQKTRWASCSSEKNISLNYKLLFLPPDLVHYVFVHELCHTVHMNHSRAFWTLVGEKLATYCHSRDTLKDAWRYVPCWVENHP